MLLILLLAGIAGCLSAAGLITGRTIGLLGWGNLIVSRRVDHERVEFWVSTVLSTGCAVILFALALLAALSGWRP